MASYTSSKASSTVKSNAGAETFTFDISSAITAASIPAYSTLTKVTITIWGDIDTATSRGKMTASFGSESICSNVWCGGSAGEVSRSKDLTISTFFYSGSYNAGKLKDSSTRLTITLDGPVMLAKFNHTATWQIYIEWTPPVYYTATFKNYDGTVLDESSYRSGLTPIEPDVPPREKDYQNTYEFSGWSSSVGAITSNTTYTAQFTATPREYEIEIICEENEYSGLKCSASGGGTYRYGDTVTLYAYDIPSNHEFFEWHYFNPHWKDNPKTFTLDEATIDLLFPYGTTNWYDDYSALYCRIIHTGFIVKANILPNNAGVVKIGFYYDLDFDGIDETYGDFRDITSQSYTVKYSEKDDWYINAIPNHGYKFVKWEDGSTENPRKVYINADAIYTAYFEEEFFTVNCSAIPAEGGTITGGGVYKRGDEVEISIRANNGYTLIGYYENSVWNEESTNWLTYYIYAKEDVDIIAHFELDKINLILADHSKSPTVLIDKEETPGILIDETLIYG